MRRALLPALASAILLSPSAWAQSPPRDHIARVAGVFKEYAKPDSPGCAVGVYQNDRIVHSAAFGMANLDHDVPLTPASVFHVASVSKQFTAAAIVLLANEGKLSLDDEVRKHVPELPDFGRKVTIRHLLHHTSGVRDQWSLLGFSGWRYSRDLITDDDVLSLLSRQKDLNYTPGERHLYSNSGFTLLAVVVSRVSGKSFRDFTTERIFRPLGMSNTHFRDNFNEVVKGQAYGYAPERGGFRLSVTNFDTAGATSLLTTVQDLAKWHANFDSHVVGGDTFVAAMLERGVLNNGQRIEYARGIAHGTYRGVATVGHGGSDAGYRAMFLRFPEQRFGVATLCNIATANPTQLSERVADIYLAGVLKKAAPTTASDLPEVPLPDAQLSKLAGLYWNAAEAQATRFVIDGGRLHVVLGGVRQRLKSIGNGKFVRAQGAGPQYAFDLSEPGRRLTMGSATAPGDVLEPVEPWTPAVADLGAFAGDYRSEEIELVYRIAMKDDALRLERLKSAPMRLEPLVADTFRTQAGVLRFTRNAAGAVTGFTIEAGRVRGLRFSRDATRPGS
jgi:CubicO group peptidase (beta-lactamase class C family)